MKYGVYQKWIRVSNRFCKYPPFKIEAKRNGRGVYQHADVDGAKPDFLENDWLYLTASQTSKISTMINKIEHLGIAVKDIDTSNELFTKLLGKAHYKTETVESEGVSTSFFQVGETKIELLESKKEDSAIGKFLAKKGEGIHHIAYAVDDIHAEMVRLEGEGFTLIHKEPFKGADNKLVCFLHPKSTNGVLVELCQDDLVDSGQ